MNLTQATEEALLLVNVVTIPEVGGLHHRYQHGAVLTVRAAIRLK